MNYEDLSELNKEFAQHTQQMTKEFYDLFYKWLKKSPRTSTVVALHLPINLIMNLIEKDESGSLSRIFPDLPDVLERFLLPFSKIKNHWGKVSSKEFCSLYEKEYESQFEKLFPSAEEKKNFSDWFAQDSKKHKVKKSVKE